MAQGTAILDDGFESYTLGPLNDQGPWVSRFSPPDPAPFIVDAPVRSGIRALRISMNHIAPTPDPSALYGFPCSSVTGRLELDVMKGSVGVDHGYIHIKLLEVDDPGDSLGELGEQLSFEVVFVWFGEIRYAGSGYPYSEFSEYTPYEPDRWYHIRIDWFPGNTADVFIDGVLKGTGLPFNSSMKVGINRLALQLGPSNDGNQEMGWFDNVRIDGFDCGPTSVAPSTWGGLKAMFPTLRSSLSDEP